MRAAGSGKKKVVMTFHKNVPEKNKKPNEDESKKLHTSSSSTSTKLMQQRSVDSWTSAPPDLMRMFMKSDTLQSKFSDFTEGTDSSFKSSPRKEKKSNTTISKSPKKKTGTAASIFKLQSMEIQSALVRRPEDQGLMIKGLAQSEAPSPTHSKLSSRSPVGALARLLGNTKEVKEKGKRLKKAGSKSQVTSYTEAMSGTWNPDS